MAPSEWSQVVELFHAALETSGDRRAAFLDEACGTQALLRKAVEELLREHESAGSFLSDPSFHPQGCTSFPDTLAPNKSFERFILREMLGAGGMGAVWSARDMELDRCVALKFLRNETPYEFDTPQIVREAKAASALNHPNIVTIHEVVRFEGCSAIVMELVCGSSLTKLRDTTVPIDEVLSISTQVAKALEAAHANRIIHGDIKPENIMLRDDGYVKVLDFGLARRFAIETTASHDGPIFGTLRYMSPEQAAGESLTPASDIYSFGLVLFELATGRRAFAAESPLDALRATLTEDPPIPASVNPRVPAALNSLILEMLAKDPGKRVSAAEVVTQLRENMPFPAERAMAEAPQPEHSQGRRFWLATVVACFVAVAAVGWFVFEGRDSPEFANLRIQPLTSQGGWEESPTFSPDGKSIAFTWAERLDVRPQIYVKQLNDREPVKLTDFHSEGTIGPLVWSPDGKWIAFKRGYKRSGAVFAVSSSGGKEKKILDLINGYSSARIDWSPDGTQLAFSEKVPQSELLAINVFNLQTGEKRQLTSPPPANDGDWNPKFSPDGRTIAFKRVSGFWADDIYTVPVAGGEARRVTWDRRGIWGHAWTADGKSLIVSCQRGSTIFGLWRFPLASPTHPERIIQGGIDAITPTVNWKTGRLAWVNQTQDVNIYRVSMAGSEPPVRLIASTLRDQDPAYSPNGQIAFVSDRSGSREIWLAHPDGSSQKRVTNFNGPDVGDLQWSVDGRALAFSSRTQGHSDIFTLDCDAANMVCENPRRVVSVGKAESPTWSADGRFLYFASDRTGRWQVWKQAVSGTSAVQVTRNGGYAALETRDGKWLYFSKNRSDAIWRIPARSGGDPTFREEMVIDPSNDVQEKGWTLTPGEIVFTERPDPGRPGALRAYATSSKRTRLILPMMEGFTDSRDYSAAVSPDYKWILYSQLDRSGSNIVVAENH